MNVILNLRVPKAVELLIFIGQNKGNSNATKFVVYQESKFMQHSIFPRGKRYLDRR